MPLLNFSFSHVWKYLVSWLELYGSRILWLLGFHTWKCTSLFFLYGPIPVTQHPWSCFLCPHLNSGSIQNTFSPACGKPSWPSYDLWVMCVLTALLMISGPSQHPTCGPSVSYQLRIFPLPSSLADTWVWHHRWVKTDGIAVLPVSWLSNATMSWLGPNQLLKTVSWLLLKLFASGLLPVISSRSSGRGHPCHLFTPLCPGHPEPLCCAWPLSPHVYIHYFLCLWMPPLLPLTRQMDLEM